MNIQDPSSIDSLTEPQPDDSATSRHEEGQGFQELLQGAVG